METYLEGDGLEVSAFLEIQVVQDVLVVLEEVQVSMRTAVAEGVHPQDLLPGGSMSSLA